jgi:hypothetical protein
MGIGFNRTRMTRMMRIYADKSNEILENGLVGLTDLTGYL